VVQIGYQVNAKKGWDLMRKLIIALAIITLAIAFSVYEVHRLAIAEVWPLITAWFDWYAA
jgi:hypothetical protein